MGGLSGRFTCPHGVNAPWEKRARFEIALPDVANSQDTCGDGAFSPAAECGPERASTLDPAEPLWTAAAPRPKWLLAPLA